MAEPSKTPVGKLALGLAFCVAGLTLLLLEINPRFRRIDPSSNPHGAPFGVGRGYAMALILLGVGALLVAAALRRK